MACSALVIRMPVERLLQMDDLPAADIDGRMIDVITADRITDLPALSLTGMDFPSGRLIPGASAILIPEMGKHALGKAEQSAPFGKACTSINIWITQKLLCISHQPVL